MHCQSDVYQHSPVKELSLTYLPKLNERGAGRQALFNFAPFQARFFCLAQDGQTFRRGIEIEFISPEIEMLRELCPSQSEVSTVESNWIPPAAFFAIVGPFEVALSFDPTPKKSAEENPGEK